MRAMLIVLAVLVLAVVGGFAAVIAFSAPQPLVPMRSVSTAFEDVDFSDMPAKQTYAARDGAKLAFRSYPGDPGRVVVLIHGSSGTTASVHPLARAISARGATVHALAMRGHDDTGRSGDIDYIGQLDDDVADFMASLGPRPAGQSRTLIGFSSGGGFALRFAGGPQGALFDRLVLVSPQFPYNAPTARPYAGGWASVAVPRLLALTVLTRFGITAFNGLPVLAMSVDPSRAAAARQTPVYSYRMLRNFGPSNDYLADVKRVRGGVQVLVGSDDEIFRADQFAPLLTPLGAKVTVVPGIGHMGMTVQPAALDAIAAAAN